MSVDGVKRQTLLSWLFVAVLVSLCGALGLIQYRWIGEVSRAEHDRLRGSLQLSLQRLSQDFNTGIGAACSALVPETAPPDAAEIEKAYTARYAHWRQTSSENGLFRRIALVIPREQTLVFRNLDLAKGTFEPAEWPAAWKILEDRIAARASGDPVRVHESFGTPTQDELPLIDLPLFDRSGGPAFGRSREIAWLIVELDLEYVRASLLPDLLQRHLGGGDKLDYHVEIVARDNPSAVIYDSDAGHGSLVGLHSDGSVGLFEVQLDRNFRRGGPQPPPGPDRGRWLLLVRHRAGSLDVVVERARHRNLAVIAAILLLMLAAIAALVQFTRRTQKLAELQMEFVAGVSHELRTPLSVIRTAAHNLGGRVISNANQVQRYGDLIKHEAEKLTAIVEQVLLFSNAKAGRVIGAREIVSFDLLIDDALGACDRMLQESRCIVEKQIEPGLPPVLGDPTALKHALQNLIGNAVKYGSEGGWIGIFASAASESEKTAVEIRVADRGPGIQREDLGHIFDTFYRGRRAVEDQIHGTGLGLSLVKRIVEAHDGTVTVQSEPGRRTEFVVRIPAAPVDQIDEFADIANRR